MSGRIEQTFARLAQAKEKALIAYLMAGDPSLAETEQLVLEIERAGADIIELGVPFSDPIADGPTIQLAAERALKSGTTLRKILSLVTALRIQAEAGIEARRIGALAKREAGVIMNSRTGKARVPRFSRDEVARFLAG